MACYDHDVGIPLSEGDVRAKIYRVLFLSFVFSLFAAIGQAAADSSVGPAVKVVYHIDDSKVARMVLNNVRNHLNATDGQARIVVVAHGEGVDFLLDGAQDKNGNPYDITVEELMGRGVDFRVCNNTLKARNIDPKTVTPGARIVPSGVAEIARLEAEGYVYLKP